MYYILILSLLKNTVNETSIYLFNSYTITIIVFVKIAHLSMHVFWTKLRDWTIRKMLTI